MSRSRSVESQDEAASPEKLSPKKTAVAYRRGDSTLAARVRPRSWLGELVVLDGWLAPIVVTWCV